MLKIPQVDPESIRRYCRDIFDSAYEMYLQFSIYSDLHVSGWSDEPHAEGGIRRPTTGSDWLTDFEIASRGVLHGRELSLFQLHYIERRSIGATRAHMKLRSTFTFQDLEEIVKEKVREELLRRGVWPLRDLSGLGYFDKGVFRYAPHRER